MTVMRCGWNRPCCCSAAAATRVRPPSYRRAERTSSAPPWTASAWPGGRSPWTNRCCAPRTWRCSCNDGRDPAGQRVRRGRGGTGADPQRRAAAHLGAGFGPVDPALPARARGPDLAGPRPVLPPATDPARPGGLMGWLDGKRALVAGAGSGIGRAVLAAFVSEGAQVGALELDPAKAARLAAELPDCVTARGDATAMADARGAVEAVTSSFGGLDVLVNCVGIFDFYRGLADIADDQLDAAFDEMFAVNVKSQLVTVRAALPELRRAGGSVVLTVSTSGFYPGRGGVLYVASKFAVRGCVIALAHELAPDVRVNGVAPGGTLGTELTGPASLGLDGQVLDATPGREDDLRRRTPLRVALGGEDHTGSYVFLASDRARGITGTVVHSDGGIGIR